MKRHNDADFTLDEKGEKESMNDGGSVDRKLIVLAGPTASGKTATAVELAKLIGGEVVSADSMQVYRGMDIGTEKPSMEERQGIPHHLIDVVDPGETFSVERFQALARRAIEEIQGRGAYPILAGGSGLYVRAVIDELEFPEGEQDSEVRRSLNERLDKEGPDVLYRELQEVDPKAAAAIHPKNVRRVMRALEVFHSTGKPFSAFQSKWTARKSIYNLRMFGLAMDRSKLYSRIDSRVYKQLERGLLEEVSSLVDSGYENFMTSSQALGYKEFVGYLRGEIAFDDAVEELKKRTRRFAKRQGTWFKADPRIVWMDAERSAAEIASDIVERLMSDSFIPRRR